MCDKIRLFQVFPDCFRLLPKPPETAKNDRKNSEGYVFMATIVDQNAKKTHPAGLKNALYRNSRLKIPKYHMKNWPIPETPMSPSNNIFIPESAYAVQTCQFQNEATV